MGGIANALAGFIHTWITEPPFAQTVQAFSEQLGGIGAALTSRVELEEGTLYTLYVESLR